jgi:hypothetical protein
VACVEARCVVVDRVVDRVVDGVLTERVGDTVWVFKDAVLPCQSDAKIDKEEQVDVRLG